MSKGFILGIRELQLEVKRVLVLGCESDGSLNVPRVERFRESAAEVTSSVYPPLVRLEVGKPFFPANRVDMVRVTSLGGWVMGGDRL